MALVYRLPSLGASISTSAAKSPMICTMNCFARFLAARITSFGHALRGFRLALWSEGNARVHLVVSILVVALGAGLGISALEWAAIAAAVGLVWMAELMNTAFETLCDIVAPERSEQVKRAKDTAAAAVLAAALAAAFIGALVFLPYLTT